MGRNRWHTTKVILESKFCFGKYNGKTIQWIIDNDIQYITWALKPGKGKVICWDYSRRPGKAKEAEDYYLSKLNITQTATP